MEIIQMPWIKKYVNFIKSYVVKSLCNDQMYQVSINEKKLNALQL